MDISLDDVGDVTRRLSFLKHKKKQAANDAQLLMNRIALLQKEEERARKKIDQTKDRASEILAMRDENEKRIQAYVGAVNEERSNQLKQQMKNKEIDQESRKNRMQQAELITSKRKEDVSAMLQEKKALTKLMLKEQEKELKEKQKKRDEVKKQEELARLKREQEKREQDRRVQEMYEKKAAMEEYEARKAEKLVKALERKEREWMEKLKQAQNVQELAFEQLESALLKESSSMSKNGSPTGFAQGPESFTIAEKSNNIKKPNSGKGPRNRSVSRGRGGH